MNGVTIEVLEFISNFISHVIVDVTIYTSYGETSPMSVKWVQSIEKN